MAKSWSRTEITIETETLVIFSREAEAIRVWCDGCEAESLMITPAAAANLAGVTTPAIYARVQAGALHYTELSDGRLLICGRSLGLNQPSTRTVRQGAEP